MSKYTEEGLTFKVKPYAEVKAEVNNSSRGRDIGAEAGVEAKGSLCRFEKEEGVFSYAVEGPNAKVRAGAKVDSDGPKLLARAEARPLGQVEAKAGPLYAEVGVKADTGVQLGLDGVSAQVAGFGFSAGTGGRLGVDTPIGSFGVNVPTLETIAKKLFDD